MKLFGKDDVMLHSERMKQMCQVNSPRMTKNFFDGSHGEVGRKVQGSLDSRAVRGERLCRNMESFVGFLKIFSDKMLMTLKSTALVAYNYPLHPCKCLTE